MKEDQNENLITKEALAKEEGITEKIGNFFTKIGYNIADFCRDHPKITKSTLVALSTTAGFFAAGPAGAVGGFFAGFQRGSDVLKFCNEFADKYEEKEFAKQNLKASATAKGLSTEISAEIKSPTKENAIAQEAENHASTEINAIASEGGAPSPIIETTSAESLNAKSHEKTQ